MGNDLHVTGIRNKKTFLPEKKALNPQWVFFLLTLKLNVRHDRPLRKKYVFRS